ncbi:MAG TPA: sigma 54-interacting transcriptional regulator [Gemmataceae bacterium]|jgi:two-component system response regulator HydG|nr:sigma 54-interacting transcriptional regulator [Gemmataceae bacterium]
MKVDTTDPAEDQLRVLVIDDERDHAETVAEILEAGGYSCAVATSGKEGARRIQSEEFDLVLTDLRMGDLDGLAIVRLVKEHGDTLVMVISGSSDVKKAVQALQEGASHYILKPVDKDELLAVVNKSADELRRLRTIRELHKQLDERFGFEGLIGTSPKMRELIERVKAFAPTKATVLILGENGTGKELVAKAIHTNSPRKNRPFVAMNCAALNENLLDDEMFGHEAGAFTGAEKLRKGKFEYANGGTLFLDEIGDMPAALQAKLLRVLENGEVTRIGSNEIIKVDVRLVAATNRDLEQMIKDGKFRQDLYYRLRVGLVRIPPLRERGKDVVLLATHFLEEFARRHGKKAPKVANTVWNAFKSYSWPGNVRELRNQLESMVIQDLDGVLDQNDLPDNDALSAASEVAASGLDHLIGRPLSEVERHYSEKALELTGGNREEAARILGIGARTLYRQIQEWKVQDRIKEALAEANGDLSRAAKLLDMTESALEKKLRRTGQAVDDE